MIEYDEYRLKTNALLPSIKDLGVSLGIEAAESELADLKKQAEADGFWNDLENSQKVMMRTKALENKIGVRCLKPGATETLTFSTTITE